MPLLELLRPTPTLNNLTAIALITRVQGLGPTGASSPPFYRQQDAFNNTYRALRVIDRRAGGKGNVLFVEFGSFGFENISYREYYNLDLDPWQLRNTYGDLDEENQARWAGLLEALYHCRGSECRF